MMDRDQRPRFEFEEAHERIPSSVGLAEGEYRKMLRLESMKHEEAGAGYLDHGGRLNSRDEWNY